MCSGVNYGKKLHSGTVGAKRKDRAGGTPALVRPVQQYPAGNHIDIGVDRGSRRRDDFLSPRRDRIRHRPRASRRDGARHSRLVQPRLHRHEPTRDPDLRRAEQECCRFFHRKSERRQDDPILLREVVRLRRHRDSDGKRIRRQSLSKDQRSREVQNRDAERQRKTRL